jgi:ABC-type branched-subunit amino acid transport system substrate-binding protein
MKEDTQPVAEYKYWQQTDPQAVKKSAYLYINSATTSYQTSTTRDATTKIGYKWPIYTAIDISETNYAPYVLEMKREGIQFVTFQGAYQQASRLAKAMRDQGFKPKIYALQSNAYTPNYIADGGAAVEGTQLAIPSQILEEINQSREMQTYAQWLNQVAPGEQPTGLGIYAWSAARLFVDTLKKVGPKLTRDAFVNELKKVKGYDGNGLLPAQDIGGRYPSDCVVVVEVKGGKFVRKHPSKGFACAKPVTS